MTTPNQAPTSGIRSVGLPSSNRPGYPVGRQGTSRGGANTTASGNTWHPPTPGLAILPIHGVERHPVIVRAFRHAGIEAANVVKRRRRALSLPSNTNVNPSGSNANQGAPSGVSVVNNGTSNASLNSQPTESRAIEVQRAGSQLVTQAARTTRMGRTLSLPPSQDIGVSGSLAGEGEQSGTLIQTSSGGQTADNHANDSQPAQGTSASGRGVRFVDHEALEAAPQPQMVERAVIYWGPEQRAEMEQVIEDIRANHPSPPGSPEAEVDVELGNEFPEAHIVLVPDGDVARIRAAHGHSEERQITGVNKTLFMYSDTLEAWNEIRAVSATIVLPRNRLLKLTVIASMRAPLVALVVFAMLMALLLRILASYGWIMWILLSCLSSPAKRLFKFLTYYLLHVIYLVTLYVWRASGYARAISSRVARYLVVAMLEVAAGYLEEFREAEAARRVL